MKFQETPLKGAFVVDLEEISDDRGHFARAFCADKFKTHGLKPEIAQINLSFNEKKGTIRGLHYQTPPAAEAKFLRCITGAIYDVIVDLRPDSPTFREHFGIELSATNRTAIYVPEMFAHGYLALTDGAQAYYSASEFYTPGVEGGLRYDDPALAIDWPIPVEVVSEKDASWPLISD
ncbi:dTDP-4-dehydrorhamnose 3,5-epimerase [Aliiroseovarius zhejiangensis]|uniref:dTDP-4-dehydrorhamnose 3,5-epimerase n=1 Tax=Aliiroseovarius zhejiangensis TaxID=1632025 RepID=A0ABQ3J7G4_9RHOB|nr:dTDP-4-dehydrorhamnose 3,5-epimerase [Aliiroseovarius zhejiangensis]GHF06633.1 dTDP-4-dehydrorhamnose 3,5-epimerase [Aliiroseovarius zhejiangensis]